MKIKRKRKIYHKQDAVQNNNKILIVGKGDNFFE
jgi:hypothetical protein